jgi:epoxyqueuosine reductase
MKSADWIEMTDDIFSHVFKNSAVKRAKLLGLKRNSDFLLSQKDSKD